MQTTKRERNKTPLGRRVASRRALLGWTQEQLAGQLGLSVMQVSRIENGHSLPTIETLVTLGRLFDVSIDWLVHGDPQTAAVA